MLERLRADAGSGQPILIEGMLGPRGDGYAPSSTMTAWDAERYHAAQLRVFADTAADMASAITLTYAEEAIGSSGRPRRSGCRRRSASRSRPTAGCRAGRRCAAAIDQVDAETDGACGYFLINCAHPTHFAEMLAEGPPIERIYGLRANASTRSHAELDEAEELDDGDPADLGARYVALRDSLPNLTVLGGCCGTDFRHVEAIADAWLAA